MKKTLFLSAILGAALCSSAFGATITVGGQTYTDATILTAAPTESVTTDYILIGADITAQNKPKVNNVVQPGWISELTASQTIISAPATAEGTTYSGSTLFIDTGDKGDISVAANIIAGGSTGNSLRLWGGNTIRLNGSLTLLGDKLNMYVQNGTHELNGALIGTSGQVLETNNGTNTVATLKINGSLAQFNGTLNVTGKTAVQLNSLGGNLVMKQGSNATFTNGKIASATGTIETSAGSLGELSILAAGAERLAVTKQGQQLTLNAGYEKTFASVTTTGTNGSYIILNAVGDTENKLYTSFYLNGTGNENDLIVAKANTTTHIGALSGVAGADVRSDYATGGNRVLHVHQDIDTTFAGIFQASSNDSSGVSRQLALIKDGTGTLTMTGANASQKELTVQAGGITFSGDGKWAGAITVNSEGTLTYAEADATIGTVTNHGTLNLTFSSDYYTDFERESGNGLGTRTYEKSGFTTLTNDGTIKVNGNTATLNDGTLTATSDSDIYYINDSAADAVINDDAQLVAGEYTISGRVLVGTKDAPAGSGVTLTLNGDTSLHSTNLVDVYHNSTVVLNDNASLNATTTGAGNMLWMHSGSKVQMADNATLIVDDYTLQGGTVTARGDAQLGGNGNQAGNATITGSAITVTGDKLNAHAISGGSVTVQDNLTTEIASTLSGSTDLVICSGATARVSHTGDNFNVNNITLGDGATLKLENARWNLASNTTITLSGDASVTSTTAYAWLNGKTLTLTGNGSVTLKGFLSGVSGNTSNQGNLNIGAGSKLTITGTAQNNATDGFIIWNGAAHTYSINGTLVIENGIRAQKEGNTSATAASATFNVGSAGLLQLNQGITFFTTASGLTSLGTINVQGAHGVGGTLAIGGQTTGNMATVNLQDGSKVVAIDAATSTEQVFTLNTQATVTFSGKGLDGTANNTLTVNSNINNSTAAVNSVGAVNFGDMNVVRLEVTGTTTVGTLETQKVIMHEDSSLTIAGADTNITTLTLGSGSTVTLGSADEDGHDFDLTTTTLTVNGDANMNANLVVESGTLNFEAGAVLTMGCEVTISGSTVYVTIEGTFDEFMADLRAGNALVVIDGLDSEEEVKALTLNGLYIKDSTNNTFTNNELSLRVMESSGFGAHGNYCIVVAPEPATATLSLLALAALAARRKRH